MFGHQSLGQSVGCAIGFLRCASGVTPACGLPGVRKCEGRSTSVTIKLSRRAARALLLQRTEHQPPWTSVLRRLHLGIAYDYVLTQATSTSQRAALAAEYEGQMEQEIV